MSDTGWRTLGLTVLGLSLAVLLMAAGLLVWQRSMSVAPVELPYVPLAVDKSLGMNSDLSQLEEAERQEVLAALESAGFSWLRQRFPWDVIEPQPGAYHWTLWDDLVEDINKRNIRLIAVLDGAPDWARSEADAENPLAPPAESRDFGDFVEAFAERYGDRIDHYQVWDEPNIAPHWGAKEIDPLGYARLLREGAIRIRASDAGAVILLAALAPNTEPGGANMSELLFLDALYQQGAAQWFDVVGAQAYSFAEPTSAPLDPDRLNWQRLTLLRDVMEQHGDGETAVWAVAFGLSDGVPEAISEAVEQARDSWPWLGPMFWAAWSPADAHGVYSLVDGGGQASEALKILQNQATAPPVASAGLYPAHHPSGRYYGDWRVTPSGADLGGSGDRLVIPFRGTRLDLIVRRGEYRAFLYVTVDGQPANSLPSDAEGLAYVVLYDPLLREERVTLAHDLVDGDHLAEISAERGWGQWAIVGWVVSREAAAGSQWVGMGLGLVALALLSVTLAWSWPRRDSLVDSVSLMVTRYRDLDDRVVLALTCVVAILAYAMTGILPTLGTLAVLALLLALRPESGLPLIALALPFYQLGRPLLGKVFSMVEILTLLTAVGWLVGWALGRWESGHHQQAGSGTKLTAQIERRLAHMTLLDWGVLALVIVGALSLLWAEHGRVAAREFRTVVLEAAIFYGLLRAMVRSRRDVWRVADAWVFGGALIALVGLFQWAFGQNLITAEGVWRVRGFYGSPNNLALYLGKVLPMVAAVAAWGQRGRRRWAYCLAAVLMATVMFLTYSRGAWVVGIPAALLFLVAMRGRRTVVLGIGLILVVAAALILLGGAGRLTSLLDTASGTTFFRLQLWKSSWTMIRDQPLLGVGLDNFLYAYRTHYVLPTAWEEFNLSHPHNFIFDFWLRLGLAGLVVILWQLVAFFQHGWQVYRRVPEGSERILVLGLMAGMVNLVAHGLVDNAFFLVDLAFVFMLLVALVQVKALEQQTPAGAQTDKSISAIQVPEGN